MTSDHNTGIPNTVSIAVPVLIVLLVTKWAEGQCVDPNCPKGHGQSAVIAQPQGRTANFVVTGPYAQQVADKAEECRNNLAVLFFGKRLPGDWSKPAKIQIDLRPNPYTSSTSFVFDRGEVGSWSGRWVGGRDELLDNVVPHEVMHMLLASHFRRRLPRWYDEGIACTVESITMQETYFSRLPQGGGYPVHDILMFTEYPRNVGAFYSQSFATVAWLAEKKGPTSLIRLGDVAFEKGNWAVAFRGVYGFENLRQVENQWQSWVTECRRKQQFPKRFWRLPP